MEQYVLKEGNHRYPWVTPSRRKWVMSAVWMCGHIYHCSVNLHARNLVFPSGIYEFGNSVGTFLRRLQSSHRNSPRWAQESSFIWKYVWGKCLPPHRFLFSLFLKYELMQPFNLNVRGIRCISLPVVLITKLLAILLDIANRYFLLSYCHNYKHTSLQHK